MNIFFINYDGYSGCSGVHIHFLANALKDLGHNCTVLVPVDKNDDEHFGKPQYSILNFVQALTLAEKRPALFQDAVLHAWTPREVVRQFTLHLSQLFKLPYFVHLEDNERHILECVYKAPFAKLEQAAKDGKMEIALQFSHPVLHQEFLAGAAGITCIIDALRRFVPENVPSEVFWPACEDAFFRLGPKPNMAVRSQLGIGSDETLITYPGNFHFANAHIMQELYLALGLLADMGKPVRLIRAGGEFANISPEAQKAFQTYGVHVGHVAATQLPALVGAANILVQPGESGNFDDCRFPSKLPLFLASGRPLITAAANLGKHLHHGEHCLLLENSSAAQIARNVAWLMDNPDQGKIIGENGRNFAQRNFNWTRSARKVEKFYQKIL